MHLIGAGSLFWGIIHYHSKKPGSVQVDIMMEKDLRVLHLDLRVLIKKTHFQGARGS